jgi:hypothetical protein
VSTQSKVFVRRNVQKRWLCAVCCVKSAINLKLTRYVRIDSPGIMYKYKLKKWGMGKGKGEMPSK